jgi:putative transcriptional regulator
MKNEFFNELIESMEQGLQHAKGERSDLRTTVLPKPPQKLASKDIVALREQLNHSQAVFARYLNVSVKAVQSWESGTRNPSGAALKLLSIAKNKPKVIFG